MVATTGRSPLYRTNPKPVLLKVLICVLGLVMANASVRAEAPTAPQPSTLPAARALDELPGSDELGKLQAALAQIKENLERRNPTAAELQGLREQIAPLSDLIFWNWTWLPLAFFAVKKISRATLIDANHGHRAIDTAQTCKPLADQQGADELVINHVGVVGLGHMGHAFAVNLIEDGHEVMVFDRNPKRTAALGDRRQRCCTARRSCRLRCGADSLPDDDALAAVALGPNGLAAILSPSAAHISTSTVSPTLSRSIARSMRAIARIISPPGARQSGLRAGSETVRARRGPALGLGKVRPAARGASASACS